MVTFDFSFAFDLLLDCDSRAVKNEVDKWVSVNLSLWFEI